MKKLTIRISDPEEDRRELEHLAHSAQVAKEARKKYEREHPVSWAQVVERIKGN
jgi:hypothetical protein